MNEGGPPGRFAPSASPLVLPHVVAGQSPAITSDMNEGGPPGRFAPSASPHVVAGQSPATTSGMDKVFTNDQDSVRNGWKVLAYLLATALTAAVLGGVLASIQLAWRQFHTILPGQWIGAAAAFLTAKLALTLEEKPLSSLGLYWGGRFARDFMLGTLAGAALIVIAALIGRGAGGFHLVRTSGTSIGTLLQGAWLYLAVAWFEELLFRGYAFQRTTDGLGFTPAQWIFAGFFAVAHWSNPGMHGATKIWASVNIALAAVLLGFCYLRTRSLALPIGVHLGWNWAQGSLLGFGVSGTTIANGFWTPVFHQQPEWLTGGAFGLEASLPCAIVCGVAILALWRWQGYSGDAATALAS